MRFEVLGPLRIMAGSAAVALTARRERVMLAMLLLRIGESVPADRLVEAVWADRPPQDVTGQLQSSVYRLRKALAAAGIPDVISTEPGGYRLSMDPQTVDLVEFQRLRDAARAAAAGGEHDAAARQYRAALQLWQGPALAGIDSAEVRRAAAALDEERVQAHQECVEAELTLGRAGELVAELTGLVEQHPYREGLHATLMRALYQTGRQADALAAYRRVRRLLHDELGTEPGAELRRLHQAILSRNPELDRPRPTGATATGDRLPPRELPAEVAGFTGRTTALKALDGMLSEPAAPVVISAIAGTAGVGKTALAVNWAHRVADRFPDGQLYINLRGYAAAQPLRPIDALAAMLRSLGVPPEQIPTDEAQAAGLYRSRLAGQRTLVVLDNAGSVEQVRPLLPGSGGCLVLITSRDRLAGLVAREGARRITLDVLAPDEARALLAQLLGTERVDAEPDAVKTLARACACLPLALRVAAANLLDHPQQTIAGYVADLTSGDPLTMLQADGDEESAVRATFDLSYQRLSADAQRLFRLLGLVPGPDVTPPAAAALTGTTVDEVKPMLAKLTTAHLLDEHAPGRYTFHDLLRLYARQLAESEESGDLRVNVLQRLYDWYLHTADAAAGLLYPQMLRLPVPPAEALVPSVEFDKPSGALTWLEAERSNLVAAIQDAADHGPRPFAWLLADCLRGYFWQRGHSVDWMTAGVAAMTAATHDGDLRAHAAARLSLGSLHDNRADFPRAIEHYTAAEDFAQRAEWPGGHAAALGNLGVVRWQLGQLHRAAEYYAQALALNRRIGRHDGQATNNINLSLLNLELGRLEQARRHSIQALALFRRLGHRAGESVALNVLGTVDNELGHLESAHAALADALTIGRELGDQFGETAVRDGLATVDLLAGRLTSAVEHARASVALSAQHGDPRHEALALNTLGRVHLRMRLLPQARHYLRRALDLASQAGSPHPQIAALVGLAAVEEAMGNTSAAADHALRALGSAVSGGYRVLEGQALTALASIHFGLSEHDKARDSATRALKIHRETGHRPGEARTLVVLGHIWNAADDAEAAQRHRSDAREMFEEMGVEPPDDLPEVSGGGRG